MKKIIIYTDGASRGNPGPAAVGFVFCNGKGEIFKEYSEYLGEATNNEAEYQAVIIALKKFKQVFGKKLAENTEIEIKADSELLAQQLNGKYKVLDPKIAELFIKIWNLKIDFKRVTFNLISRQKNQAADELANKALDGQSKIQPLL